MKTMLITGSAGLIGSACVDYFVKDYNIIGIDCNARGKLFGPDGSIKEISEQNSKYSNYTYYNIDIYDIYDIERIIQTHIPDVIIHCAGQPSHEKSAEIPFDDFKINTVGTVNILESMRRYSPESTFIFTSTNKVYGDSPNSLVEVKFIKDRISFELIIPKGISEDCKIDYCTHSPFGANKLAADIITQEYGRYFGLNTVCFRCGCITGKNHKGVEQHGFLSYLVKTIKNKQIYTIYGYEGKQVRDNLHAYDLVKAFELFINKPIKGAVYNIGGGKENSCSIFEAAEIIKEISGLDFNFRYNPNPRVGDHMCYYTDFSKFQSHYPTWNVSISLKDIIKELLCGG